MDSAAVTSLECCGACGSACWEIIKDANMQVVGMLAVEYIMRMFVVKESIHWIHKWIVERIMKWVMIFEEISEQIKRISGMEMCISVEMVLF